MRNKLALLTDKTLEISLKSLGYRESTIPSFTNPERKVSLIISTVLSADIISSSNSPVIVHSDAEALLNIFV